VARSIHACTVEAVHVFSADGEEAPDALLVEALSKNTLSPVLFTADGKADDDFQSWVLYLDRPLSQVQTGEAKLQW
jgi:hypothetical protein